MTVETIQKTTECLPPTQLCSINQSSVKKNLFDTKPNRRENKKLYELVMQDQKDRLAQYQITEVIRIIPNKESITSHELELTPPPSEDEETCHEPDVPESQIPPVVSRQPERAVEETKSGKSKFKSIRVIAPYDSQGKSKQKTMKGEFCLNIAIISIKIIEKSFMIM